MHIDVLLGGTVFCDLVFAGPGLAAASEPGTEVYADHFEVTPGGTATRAVALARLGLRTGLVGTVGTDMFGDRVVADLAAEPTLDLRWLRRDASLHTAVTVASTDGTDRSFLTYEQPGTAVPAALDSPPTARMVNIGLGRPVPPWVEALRADGATVYGGLGFDPARTWPDEVRDRFAGVDVLCVNDVEATGYGRVEDPAEAAARLTDHVPLVVVTCGARGVVAHDARTGSHLHVPAVEVPAVDPTGAGDNFVAGLMLAALRDWDLETALRFGTLTAALSVRRLGGAASAPTPGEIAEFLDRTEPDGDWSFARDWARGAEVAA